MGYIDINDAITQFRMLVSDGTQDKIVYQKKCFGLINGINTLFKTFEARRVTNFTTASSGFGVFKNSVALNPSTDVASDDLISGQFVLNVAPIDGDVIEATYYYQWFLDTEATQFLNNAFNWLGLSTDPTQIPNGLIPAHQHYTAQDAYHKLAARWSVKMAETYQLEDAPDPKNVGIADSFRKIAMDFKQKALELRNEYYTRQGQGLQPLFGNNLGAVRDYMPKR